MTIWVRFADRLVTKVITTAKTFKAARQDGKGNPAAAAVAMEARVPASVEQFNAILDDIESEIVSLLKRTTGGILFH